MLYYFSVMQIQYCFPGYETGFGVDILRNEHMMPGVDIGLLAEGLSQS